jgi:hypothetical protein
MKALLSVDPGEQTGDVTATGVTAFASRLGWHDPTTPKAGG